MVQQPLVGQGLLIVDVSRLPSDTPHSVGPLWRMIGSTQRHLPDKTQQSQERDIHAPGGIRAQFPTSELLQIHDLDGAVDWIGVASNYVS